MNLVICIIAFGAQLTAVQNEDCIFANTDKIQEHNCYLNFPFCCDDLDDALLSIIEEQCVHLYFRNEDESAWLNYVIHLNRAKHKPQNNSRIVFEADASPPICDLM